MTTTPLGENPYLYQGGPTVPLRQQRTGAYAANSFGNRVFYTPEGQLPGNTLAPGLAPTPGALLRQNLSGAGLAGAAISGALQSQAAYSQGAGLFEGLGVGLGTTIGAIGGQAAGAAAGASVGGAAGSAVPGVGNVAGAGAGTTVGAIGGGLAGGAVGGAVGGGIGRALDDFFWPNPADPAIGIPTQPKDAQPVPSGIDYPGQTNPAALEAGPTTSPGVPASYTGGQMDGVLYRAIGKVTWDVFVGATGETIASEQDVATESILEGPISSGQAVYSNPGPNGPRDFVIAFTTGSGVATAFFISNPIAENSVSNAKFSGTMERGDGLPDTGGDPPPVEEGVKAPNPARTPSRPIREPYYPASSGTPSERPADSPWPERPSNPIADSDPFAETAPFTAPTAPFNPTPDPLAPTGPTEEPTPTSPQPPLDPLNPVGPSGPIPSEKEQLKPTPFFIPIPIPTAPFNRPDFKDPDVPVSVPVGLRQPATTPTGDPGQLINPTITPTPNPNVSPQIEPVQQPARIEQGGCCIPPPSPDLIKRLEEIKKGIGVDGLPASVVDQIAKDNPGQIQIGSLAELHLWQVQQLDGVLGKWPVGIPIPTPAGTTTVGMPNMAEAVAEMVGMLVSQQVTAAQILNTSSRAMVQAGSATQQAHLAHLTAQANADFLGYESRANAVDMPLTYTPGRDPSDGLLSESTAKIRGFQNTDKTDIKAILAELLQAAAIIRAVYWRRVDPKGDLKSQIRENVKGQSDFLDEAAAGGGSKGDWEAYLKDVEEGFKSATGEANPYGRPPEEGPKIRDRSPGDDKKR